jgi:phosphotransferase system HPr (HPr) family protein
MIVGYCSGGVRGLVMSGEVPLSKDVLLKVAHGLHLSPISQVVRCASAYSSSVTLSFDGRTADAKSVYDLMQLAAPFGANIRLEVQGSDAAAALDSVSALFDGGFITGPEH